MTALGGCRFSSSTGACLWVLHLFFGARYDLCPVGAVGRQDTMVTHQIEPSWRHQSSQFLDQFQGGQHQVRRAVGPGCFEGEGQASVVDALETSAGQRWT